MQRLVDAGELTEEEAARSERRNIILQALGPDAQVKVDLTHQVLRRGDTLVICSDGLSGLVRKEEFAEQVAAHGDLDSLCSALIALANERGGPDNITVVVARFGGDGLPEPSEAEDVGYQVFDLPEEGAAEAEAIPLAVAPAPVVAPASVAPPPVAMLPGSRQRGLILAIAALCLLAAMLVFWL
jgi:protein phosphatase